jgi:aryl-alcohol dehydrogenase-like predicted oxidoreductase
VFCALNRVSWAEKVGWTETSWSTKSVEQTWNILDQLKAIAKELNVSVAAVALRWIIQRDGVTSTIIGARTMEQFNQNMQAIDIDLSNEQMAQLTKASDTPLPYPYNIIQMVKHRDNS